MLFLYPFYWWSHTSGRFVHKGFKRGKRDATMSPLPITRLWFVTSVLMTSLPRKVPGHPHTLDKVMRWEQQNEWLRNTSCLPQCLTPPNTNSNGWCLSCPWPCQIPLQLLPPIRNTDAFPSPTMNALLISWGRSVCFRQVKRKIASKQFSHSRGTCYTVSTLDYTFDLYQPIHLVHHSWVM